MRFVAPDAQLSVMEIKWGLVPDVAGIVLMRGLVRDDVARELIFSVRIVNGQEASRLGLATRVCDNPRREALAAIIDLVKPSLLVGGEEQAIFGYNRLPAGADASGFSSEPGDEPLAPSSKAMTSGGSTCCVKSRDRRHLYHRHRYLLRDINCRVTTPNQPANCGARFSKFARTAST